MPVAKSMNMSVNRDSEQWSLLAVADKKPLPIDNFRSLVLGAYAPDIEPKRIHLFFQYNGVLTPTYIKREVSGAQHHALHPLFKGWPDDAVDAFFTVIDRTEIPSFEIFQKSVELFKGVWEKCFGEGVAFSGQKIKELLSKGTAQNSTAGIQNIDAYWYSYLALLEMPSSDVRTGTQRKFLEQAALLCQKGLFTPSVTYAPSGAFLVDRERVQRSLCAMFMTVARDLIMRGPVQDMIPLFNTVYAHIHAVQYEGQPYHAYLVKNVPELVSQNGYILSAGIGLHKKSKETATDKPLRSEEKHDQKRPPASNEFEHIMFTDEIAVRARVFSLRSTFKNLGGQVDDRVQLYYRRDKLALGLVIKADLINERKFLIYLDDEDGQKVHIDEFSKNIFIDSAAYADVQALPPGKNHDTYNALYEKFKKLIMAPEFK